MFYSTGQSTKFVNFDKKCFLMFKKRYILSPKLKQRVSVHMIIKTVRNYYLSQRSSPGVELTAHVQRSQVRFLCKVKDFFPYSGWVQQDNLLSSSKQRPYYYVMIHTPNDTPSDLKMIANSIMIGCKNYQKTKLEESVFIIINKLRFNHFCLNACFTSD